MQGMKLGVFRAADLKSRLRDDPGLVAVASTPMLEVEMAAHGFPADRTGMLYCLEGERIVLMDRTDYDELKEQEGKLIEAADQRAGKAER